MENPEWGVVCSVLLRGSAVGGVGGSPGHRQFSPLLILDDLFSFNLYVSMSVTSARELPSWLSSLRNSRS